MDVFEAAYRVGHDFKPDGAVGLARKMGKNPGTFLNKLNTNTETHQLSLAEALAMSVVAGDSRIAEAFCWELGGFFVAKPECGGMSDLELLTLWLARERKSGGFAEVVDRCFAHGRISEKDWKEIEVAGVAYLGAFLELMYRFKAMRHGR